MMDFEESDGGYSDDDKLVIDEDADSGCYELSSEIISTPLTVETQRSDQKENDYILEDLITEQTTNNNKGELELLEDFVKQNSIDIFGEGGGGEIAWANNQVDLLNSETDPHSPTPLVTVADNTPVTADVPHVPNDNSSVLYSKRGPKRQRTSIGYPQIKYLRSVFEMLPRPNRQELESICLKVHLSYRVVQVWFQNQRLKQKRLEKKNKEKVMQQALNEEGQWIKSNETREANVNYVQAQENVLDSPEIMGSCNINPEPMTLCNLCGKWFKNSALAYYNQSLVCPACIKFSAEQNMCYYPQNDNRYQTLPTNDYENSYRCSMCSQSFMLQEDLYQHSVTSHNFKPNVCDVCGSPYPWKCDTYGHRLSNNESNALVCYLCGKSFRRKANFSKHMLYHNDPKKYVCKICDKSFFLEKRLSRHMLYQHGQKLFVCSFCGTSCFSEGDLTDHMLTHSNLQQFFCAECEESFADKADLAVHLVTHNDKKLHSCSVCNKSFKLKSEVKKHSRCHLKSYNCDVCSISFAHKSDLSAHVLSHSNERPHICSVCDRTYKRERDFRNHQLIHGVIQQHSTEQQFSCYVCGSIFSSQSQLFLHISTHNQFGN